MAEQTSRKRTHKEWRKEVKKLRRKRIRQKLAAERNKKTAEEHSARLNDPIYQAWLKQQEELEAVQLEQEERHRQEQEELWLRRELLAKKHFREQQRKYEATAAVKEAERLRIQKEFEEIQQQAQKRREERKQREEQARKDHEQILDKIAEYIEIGGSIPNELMSNVQSNPSKPPCPFFSKTNACRYGLQCSRNHIRPKLSKILLFPNFFSHIKLEQSKSTEYGCDINLECTENELNNDYTEFFTDVIEELEKFGEILNFRTCMNSQPHLRGNVLVEYIKDRDALKAYMQLQGRYYASRRINVEFSSIASWKSAICGLSYTNKCPKGRNCNFLHIFRNPGNSYNLSAFKQEESTRNTSRRSTRDSSVMSWNEGDDRSSRRNWRWSESPEPAAKRKPSDERRPSVASSTNRRGHSSSRSESNKSSERRYRSKKNSRSRSNERRSSYSSRDSRHIGHSSSRRKERTRSKSKSPKNSQKHRDDDDQKKHQKDKKRKHKSKSSKKSKEN